MKMKHLAVLCVLIACCVGVVMPQQADAATTTFKALEDNEYDNPDNWDPSLPINGDIAIIDTGKTCNLDVATANLDKLEVKSTANLNVKAGGRVRLTTVTTSVISGTLTLESSDSKIEVTASLTISGAGSIVGTDNSAEIALSDDVVLTNSTTIEGKLKITGSSEGTQFKNSGVVHANAAGTLWVNTYDIEDTAAGLWRVSTSSSAILRFDPAITTGVRSLEGDFTVEAGRLNSNVPGFYSTGTLIWTAGVIDSNANNGAQARCTGS